MPASTVDAFTEVVAPTSGAANGPITDIFNGNGHHSNNGLADSALDGTNGVNGAHGANGIQYDLSEDCNVDPHGVKEQNSQSRPRTPTRPSMALTDYSINPTTPSEEKRAHIRDLVPEDYLLPNGHPDVSIF
jgi:hypothetical protein